jgi:hypothetical protein
MHNNISKYLKSILHALVRYILSRVNNYTLGLDWIMDSLYPYNSWLSCTNIKNTQKSQSQSQSYITTDGQSASLSWCQAPIWDPRPAFLLLSLIVFRQFCSHNFATAVVATDSDPAIASQKPQTNLLAIQNWFKKWRVTFTTRRETCPPVHINSVQLSLEEDVKYLGLHLHRRLTWHKHIFAKRKQLVITLTKMYRLLGRKSKLSTRNKLLIYKIILKSTWTYGIQLWGTASTSNI